MSLTAWPSAGVSVTSATAVLTGTPCLASRPAADARPSAPRATSPTAAPSAASASATANPMPRLAPVISAREPRRPRSTGSTLPAAAGTRWRRREPAAVLSRLHAGFGQAGCWWSMLVAGDKLMAYEPGAWLPEQIQEQLPMRQGRRGCASWTICCRPGAFGEAFDPAQGRPHRLLAPPVTVAHEHVLGEPGGQGQTNDVE